MRKGIKRAVGWLIVMLIAVCFSTTVTSCDDKHSFATQDYVNETVAAGVELASESVNPTFGTVNEVLVFRQQMIENCFIDDLFRKLDEQIITEVAAVLLKRGDPCTKRTIIKEYDEHSSVYDNISSVADPPASKTTSVVDNTYNSKTADKDVVQDSKDTIIDGKPYRSLTQENVKN